MTVDTSKLDMYWASISDNPDLLLDLLKTKISDYYDDIDNIGLVDLWNRSYRAYYGGATAEAGSQNPLFDGSRLNQRGKTGEKTSIKVNHLRNLIKHIHQLATSQRPVTQARSTNSDYRSQAQTLLANGLIDYYRSEQHQERYLIDAAELALVYAEGFIHCPWNPKLGKELTKDLAGNPINEGDQEYRLFNPMDVIRDPANKTGNQDWTILRSTGNRWDLAATYPMYYEEIMAASIDDQNNDSRPHFNLRGNNEPENDDIITLYTFYHNKTPALPNGRMMTFLPNVILLDGPLAYDKVPVYRIAAQQLLDTIYGYSVIYDLLPIQEGIDELHKILFTNNKTFGIPNIWTSSEDNISVSMLSSGLRHMKSQTKPEAVNLTASAPETYNYLDRLEQSSETLAGISSTVRGQPEASLKSGAALALVVSQSIQFISSFEESYNRLIEDVSTALIQNIRTFSKSQRVAHIVGESSRPFMKSYDSSDLAQISRVIVERVSPLSKTIAGKVEIANNLLQQGMIENPKQYMMILTTGQLDPAIEGTQHELLNIRAENEEMREGIPVQAVIIENHALHIQEHKNLINNPEAKKDPNLMALVMQHIQEHLDLWRAADPAILMITGQNPPPPPAGMGMGAPAVMNSTPPIMNQAQEAAPAGMPSLPEASPVESQAAYEKMTAGSMPAQ